MKFTRYLIFVLKKFDLKKIEKEILINYENIGVNIIMHK